MDILLWLVLTQIIKESETPESDIACKIMMILKGLYNILKTYNKNIFPIKSLNINGV
jgi:hypothetical protein